MNHVFRFTLWLFALLLPALAAVSAASRAPLLTAPTVRHIDLPLHALTHVSTVQHPAVVH
ncbi:MAG TPA: hypothetical protein VFK69_12635 [Candidatus Eisenbacteria bacterium]|nr:hypothetical protein [Candidatus Eisenbacteria bacterium]